MALLQVVDYETAIQARLVSITGTKAKVYKLFNRNFANDPSFVTWQLRNVHQQVYSGIYNTNLGIGTPTVQITVFDQSESNGVANAQLIVNSLHGFTGYLNPNNTGILIGKADVDWVYQTYDNTVGLSQVVLDVLLNVTS